MDPYKRLTKRELYSNPWVAVEAHEIVHPTGARGEHVLIVTPPASAVLVIDGEEVILAAQPRFGARQSVIEVVKGGADPGEDALACAKRELREELGLEAATWTSLGTTFELPSLVALPVTVFAASRVTHTASDPEAVEQIQGVRMTLEDAYAATCDGRIDDAVTIVALARYRGFIPAAPSADSKDARARRDPR
jgi:8-oxo-dGTP pyrophosphatase MutT (NUDIX family)